MKPGSVASRWTERHKRPQKHRQELSETEKMQMRALLENEEAQALIEIIKEKVMACRQIIFNPKSEGRLEALARFEVYRDIIETFYKRGNSPIPKHVQEVLQ